MSIPAATRRDLFGQAAAWTARASGTRWAFGGAVGVIASWGLLGPLFHYSETWQLVINTGTTIVTFLMVFLIQNAQNRESKAIHLKLDELIRSTQQADNAMIDVEGLSEAQLDALGRRYHQLARQVDAEIGAVELQVEAVAERVERVERKVAEDFRAS